MEFAMTQSSHSRSIPTNQVCSGILTALVTPFWSGEIDWESLRKLVRAQLDGGVQGLVVGGTTAESPTLSGDEKRKLFEFVKSEVASAVPLVMGTGSNSTAETVQATRAAKEWGAAAALVVVPYYNKPPQRGLVAHFRAVAQASDLPVILYNVPSRTITALSLESIVELSRVPGIVAIKEASGDLRFGQQIAQQTQLLLSSGDDGSALALAGVGGRGVISVISHLIPREFTELFKLAVGGDAVTAQRRFDEKYGGLNSHLYCEANPIPVKYALWKMGILRSPELRLPLIELDPTHRSLMDQHLRSGGLL
jgi:4-hydroxy-tetrahydrodipicolinate synthase